MDDFKLKVLSETIASGQHDFSSEELFDYINTREMLQLPFPKRVAMFKGLVQHQVVRDNQELLIAARDLLPYYKTGSGGR